MAKDIVNVFDESNPKYYGKYIAKDSFQSSNVVCDGESFVEVYGEAVRRGIKEPVVKYIQDPRIGNLYPNYQSKAF